MSEDRKYKLHHGGMGAAIAVRITPRSSKDEVSEILDDGTIKLRITASPVEGAANRAVIQFLAKILEVPPSEIEIVAGATSRDKLITIANLTPEQVHARIIEHLA